MRFTFILAAWTAAFGSAGAAGQQTSPLKVFESLNGVPQGWALVGTPDPVTRLRLRLALQMPDHELFEQTLFNISDPDHEDYGKHLNREELRSLIKPRDEVSEAVVSWVKSSGVAVSDIQHNDEWINFYISIAAAESMLNTTFNYFTNDADKTHAKQIRTLRTSVPESLSSHIAMIEPTTRFGQMRAEMSTVFKIEKFVEIDRIQKESSITPVLNVTACNASITPGCLRALYNVGDYVANSKVGSLFGVCGYLEQYAKYNELDIFLEKYAPYAKGQNFTYDLINGGQAWQNQTVSYDDTEANLDIQYAASIGYKQNIEYYSTGGRGILVPDLDQPDINENSNEPYLEFLTHLLKRENKDLPQTITTSYGEDEQSVPISYTKVLYICPFLHSIRSLWYFGY
jgi:tripeptidyl-peptidase-1